ncbi:MAG: hypothetical protein OXE84_15010 [Rhodobacteraceae bacterium]|nr:hypothetical protein [Paracoccaceae bacterium]MCY4196958.1 hypothetical protein [Paracoccaceae bacterium]MCY4326779.1 hypothetical protein [Paracoccaceae bacterium]
MMNGAIIGADDEKGIILMTRFVIFLFALMPAAAGAQVTDIGDMAAGLQAQAGDIADLIGAAAFLLGICIGIVGLMKFRQHSQNPNDPSARLSTAFTLVFVGAALVAVPTTLGVGIGSLFGTGATNVSVDGTLRNIN